MNMKLLAVLTQPSIYNGCYNRKTPWEEKFTPGEFTHMKIKKLVVLMLGNTGRPRMARSTSPWKSL